MTEVLSLIQVIGYLNSNDTKKAIRYLKERRKEYQFVDLKERSLSKRELENIFMHFSPQDCIDTTSACYRKRLAYMVYDAAQELEENNELFITPILRCRGKVALGFDAQFLEENA